MFHDKANSPAKRLKKMWPVWLRAMPEKTWR